MAPRSHGIFSNYVHVIKTFITVAQNCGIISEEYLQSQIQVLESIHLNELNTPKTLSDASKNSKLLYFKNLKTLWGAISETVQDSGCYDVSSLYPAICISMLLWYGFHKHEIVEIKKADVLETGVINPRTKKLVKMDSLSMDTIHRYKESEGYYRLGRGPIFIRYLDSPFLFRSDRTEQFGVRNIKLTLSRFGSYLSRKFSFESRAIYTSGLFNRIATAEFNGTFSINDLPLDAAAKYFELDYDGSSAAKAKVISSIESYKAYKRMFS